MKIGILHEGRRDLSPVQTFINRIVDPQEEIIYKSYDAKGEIITKMKPALALFQGEKVDLSIFVSDIDNFPERRTNVKSFIKEHTESIIIPAFCEPHLEEWFIIERNSIVSVLEVDPQYPFKKDPLRDNPKELIRKFIQEKYRKNKEGEEVLTEPEFYQKITETIDIQLLVNKDSDFKNFNKELKNFIKNKSSKRIKKHKSK